MAIRMSGLLGVAIPLLVGTTAQGDANQGSEATRQNTYAWLFARQEEMRPWGGSTKGPDVVLDTKPSPTWKALQELRFVGWSGFY